MTMQIETVKNNNKKDLEAHIKSIPDFPKAGINFRDMMPLLRNPKAFKELVREMTLAVRASGAECVVGLEARGFILGAAVALEAGLPFVPARKPGKLPGETAEVAYALEYGEATLQIQTDSIVAGTKVAIVDDLLATGGTAAAAIKLVEKLGGTVSACVFAIELAPLAGRKILNPTTVCSVVTY